MAHLDLNYVADLILQAQNGDSNAFAEFFAATHNKQYQFACRCLKEPFAAQEVLQETYTRALKGLSRLREPLLAVTWLTQINMRCCFEHQTRQAAFARAQGRKLDESELPLLDVQSVQVGGAEFTMQQVMNLPFSESQSILLRTVLNMKHREIANLLEITPREVRRYIDSGIRRLNGVESVAGSRKNSRPGKEAKAQ